MRVSGFVRDADTSEPVSNCGVRVGEKYSHVDSAGRYVVKSRFDMKRKNEPCPPGCVPGHSAAQK